MHEKIDGVQLNQKKSEAQSISVTVPAEYLLKRIFSITRNTHKLPYKEQYQWSSVGNNTNIKFWFTMNVNTWSNCGYTETELRHAMSVYQRKTMINISLINVILLYTSDCVNSICKSESQNLKTWIITKNNFYT